MIRWNKSTNPPELIETIYGDGQKGYQSEYLLLRRKKGTIDADTPKYCIGFYFGDTPTDACYMIQGSNEEIEVEAWAPFKELQEAKNLDSWNIKDATNYLRARGIPKQNLRAIMNAYEEQALLECKDIMMDRVYTAIALALCNSLSFGYKRIKRLLRAFSDVIGQMEQADIYWDEKMDELYQKTGMVIHTCGEGYARISIEYKCPNGEYEMTEDEQEQYTNLVESMEDSISRKEQAEA